MYKTEREASDRITAYLNDEYANQQMRGWANVKAVLRALLRRV